MLLDAGRVAEFLAAFKATMRKEPNRVNAYAGAARTAEKAGNTAKINEYYGKLRGLAKGSGSDRPNP
jgi:uncharacterized protein HemY